MLRGILTRQLLTVVLAGLALIFLAQALTRLYFEVPVLLLLESELDRREAERARIALRQRFDELITIAADYSVWSDTYEFIQANPDSDVFASYVESNLVFSTHENNQINGFIYMDTDYRVHHFTSYNRQTGEKLGIQPFSSADLSNVLLQRIPFEHHEDRSELINAGFVESKVGPVLFAALDILPSDGVGERRGILVVWRLFDDALTRVLGEQLQLSITYFPASTARTDPNLASRIEQLSAMETLPLLPRDADDQLYWLIRSINGNPLFLVKQAAPTRQFNSSWRSRSVLVAFGGSALVLLVIGLLFSRWVIAPLNRAGEVLNSISSSGNYALRVQSGTRHEIGQLFGFVNHLLACIQTLEMELRGQNRRLEALTQEDPLTGIANRRHLDQYLESSWTDCLVNQQSISICLIDIDCFKQFNDSYGHQSGDRVLRQVARTLADNLHAATDFIARYGGEEFCVVLSGTSSDSALRVAERLRCAVEGLEIRNVNSIAGPILTISIGVASIVPEANAKRGNLIHAADQALYQAKENGRNQISGPLNYNLNPDDADAF